MKKVVLVVVPVLAASLAGCGGIGDTCSTAPADIRDVAGCGGSTVQPNADVVIQVHVCPTCAQTSPSCNTEIVNDQFELNPVVQECQANAGCPASGCNLEPVSCTIHTPNNGTFNVVTQLGTSYAVTVASGGTTSCSF